MRWYHPWIRRGGLAVSPTGTVYVAYITHDGELRCYRSLDGASSWSPSVVGRQSGQPIQLAVQDAGTVGVAWHETILTDGESRGLFAYSEDEGQTWTTPTRFPTDTPSGGFQLPTVAAFPGGAWGFAIFWGVPWGPDHTDLYYARRLVDGTWAPSIRVNTHSAVPSIHATETDKDGHVYLAWTEEDPVYRFGRILFTTDAPVTVPVEGTSWSELKSKY